MASKDDKLATFRIDTQKWERFKNWASGNNSSASAVLLNLIDRCLAGEITASSTTTPTTNVSNLDSLIDERIKAKLNELETLSSQPHHHNLDAILDERDRHLESRILSILETMLETKLEDKLEELQGNIHNIEYTPYKRIEKLSQTPIAAPTLLGDGGTGNIEKVEVEAMQQSNDQLLAQISALQSENESLLQQNQELQQELGNVAAVPQLPDLYLMRDSVLKTLISGKGKVATTSPQYKTAARALDRFIDELQKSTPESTPASSTPDGTAAPRVSEATKKLESKHYTKDEYYADLRQIVERCGYRLFIDTTTLGRNRELFIVNPPSNSTERIISTQDVGEVVDWLRRQDLTLDQ